MNEVKEAEKNMGLLSDSQKAKKGRQKKEIMEGGRKKLISSKEGVELKLKKMKEEDEDGEDVDTNKMPDEIGPDGVPLRRNATDVMNNYFIDIIARSFTNIDLGRNPMKARADKMKAAKFENEIKRHKK